MTLDFDNIIKSIVRMYKWTPDEVGRLNIIGKDYRSLIFWYNDVKDYVKEIKEKTKI